MPSSLTTGFAELAADCYNQKDSGLNFHGWRRSTHPTLGSVTDGNFYACAYELKKTDVVAIAFRGTVISNWGDVVADLGGIGLSLNSLVLDVQTALDFAWQWSTRTKNIWLTGHSLGGAYVQIVAAILNMCGATFNAPGVVHLVNQYSNHPLTRFGGGIFSPVMQIMASEFHAAGLVDYFTEALAADDDLAFAPVLNYRAQFDPVGRLGVHVGAPMEIIQVRNAANPHAMSLIVEALGGKVVDDKAATH